MLGPLGTILLVILIVIFACSVPAWPYAANWGYGPVSGVGILIIILIVLLLSGRI